MLPLPSDFVKRATCSENNAPKRGGGNENRRTKIRVLLRRKVFSKEYE
jgi:hypothetical protein